VTEPKLAKLARAGELAVAWSCDPITVKRRCERFATEYVERCRRAGTTPRQWRWRYGRETLYNLSVLRECAPEFFESNIDSISAEVETLKRQLRLLAEAVGRHSAQIAQLKVD
jgi:hypothetical protein